MLALARWLGDVLWKWVLWLARRRVSRRVHRSILGILPGALGRSAWALHLRQNRFARRVGRVLLRSVALFALSTLLLAALYGLALFLLDRGYIPREGRFGTDGNPKASLIVGTYATMRPV
jgi:hypothetical protein